MFKQKTIKRWQNLVRVVKRTRGNGSIEFQAQAITWSFDIEAWYDIGPPTPTQALAEAYAYTRYKDLVVKEEVVSQ